MADRTEYYSKTSIDEVFIWQCDKCGMTSLPIVFAIFGDADDACHKHWADEHSG